MVARKNPWICVTASGGAGKQSLEAPVNVSE